MYKLIIDIIGKAKRCYETAVRRKKDTSDFGCLQSLDAELSEYWDAVDNGKTIPDFDETTAEASRLSDKDFNALYDEKIHNTTLDELADILITTATWLHSAKMSNVENFKPKRRASAMMLDGVAQFLGSRISGPCELERLRTVVNLKMRYNETRND